MPPEPLVSIITAVRDGARTIGATIDSVRAQTEPGWEHLVIDDGSIDETPAAVAAAADSRLRYERQPPLGVSAARNRALELARGAFLLFLDADDWLLPPALERHLQYLAAHPSCGVSVSDGRYCADDGTAIATFSERRGTVPAAGMLAGLLINPGLVAAPLAAMVRADIVRRHRIRFDPRLAIGEDTLFWIEVARYAQFGFLDAVTCGYRWHAGNATLRSSPAFRRAQHAQLARTVLAAPYFAELPATARADFLQCLLIDTFAEQPDEQAQLAASPPFRALPATAQARLLRLAASEHLLAGGTVEPARGWLRQARRLAPRDPIAHGLAALLAVHPRLAQLAIRIRRRGAAAVEDPLWRHAENGSGGPLSSAPP